MDRSKEKRDRIIAKLRKIRKEKIKHLLHSQKKPPIIREPVAQQIARQEEVKDNKTQVQEFEVETFQMYNIEVAKAVATNTYRKIFDDITYDGFERGHKPFAIRPMRYKNKDYEKVIYHTKWKITPQHEGRKMQKWFVPWLHNVAIPGFITYSALPWIKDDVWHRFIDIDYRKNPEENELGNYYQGQTFDKYYNKLVYANQKAIRMSKYDVECFTKVLQKISDNILAVLGKENTTGETYYSGGGFRLITTANSKEELNNNIETWKQEKKICESSTSNYQLMKTFSVSTLNPHLGTEMNPYHKLFKYSNPAFFLQRYDKKLENLCYEYKRSYRKKGYQCKNMQELYETMKTKQKNMEEEIIKCL
jgi:hypothetical protein